MRLRGTDGNRQQPGALGDEIDPAGPAQDVPARPTRGWNLWFLHEPDLGGADRPLTRGHEKGVVGRDSARPSTLTSTRSFKNATSPAMGSRSLVGNW